MRIFIYLVYKEITSFFCKQLDQNTLYEIYKIYKVNLLKQKVSILSAELFVFVIVFAIENFIDTATSQPTYYSL